MRHLVRAARVLRATRRAMPGEMAARVRRGRRLEARRVRRRPAAGEQWRRRARARAAGHAARALALHDLFDRERLLRRWIGDVLLVDGRWQLYLRARARAIAVLHRLDPELLDR